MSDYRPVGDGYFCDCGTHDIDETCLAGTHCRAAKDLPVRIWSAEHVAWWRYGSAGYTTDPLIAGVFGARDALERTIGVGPEKQICIDPMQHGVFRMPRNEFQKWYEEKYLTTKRILHPTVLNARLNELIEQARNHVMSPEELFEQAVSFAYSNVSISNPLVTREMVHEAMLAELPNKRLLLGTEGGDAMEESDAELDWLEFGW